MIRVRDLQDQIGKLGPQPILYCLACGGEYSANAGDYFMESPDQALTCCGEPMILTRRRIVFEPVEPGKEG